MSLYHGAQAKVRLVPDKFTYFKASVLAYMLAPYIFVIVLDWVLSSVIIVDDLGI